MAAKPSTLLILISLLLSYTIVISSLSTTTNSSKPISPSKSPLSSPSPPPSLIPPTKSPSPKLISPTKSPSPILISPTKSPSIPPPALSSSPLDPKQLTALQSLNIPLSKNPCSQPSIHNATLCNSDKPFSHLISLRLLNCSDEVQISSTALRSLSTLQDFQFINCPIPPIRFPPDLISNLRSFTCIKSLKKLSGVYLGKLRNLTDLTVTDVPIKASGPVIIIGTMKKLKTVKISHTNLTGFLPRKWNLNITHLDLSNNLLKGKVPTSLTLLADLQFLNLSSNTLSGELPESFGDLISLQNVSLSSNKLSGQIPDSISEIPSLVHLDLSSNQFNGTIPKFINRMKNLKYLNLESNNFHGVMPFNESFIKKFEVFKIGGNSNLCFNHSIVSKKLKLGIAQCDKDGLPVPPPPDKSSDSGFGDGSDSSDDTVDDDNDDGSNQKDNHSHGPNKVVLGVAIGLSSLIFVIVFLVLLSKRCG